MNAQSVSSSYCLFARERTPEYRVREVQNERARATQSESRTVVVGHLESRCEEPGMPCWRVVARKEVAGDAGAISGPGW